MIEDSIGRVRILVAGHAGERLPLFDRIGIPIGWVIDGNLHQKHWSVMRTTAVPLRPGGKDSDKKREAEECLNKMKRLYFGDVAMLLIPDHKTEEQFSASFVLISDLQKDSGQLLKERSEALHEAHETTGKRVKVRDYLLRLASMKRTAYIAVSGYTDTK